MKVVIVAVLLLAIGCGDRASVPDQTPSTPTPYPWQGLLNQMDSVGFQLSIRTVEALALKEGLTVHGKPAGCKELLPTVNEILAEFGRLKQEIEDERGWALSVALSTQDTDTLEYLTKWIAINQEYLVLQPQINSG